jgi:hypothetical protein
MPFDVRSRDLEGPPEVAVDTDTEECAPLRARPETNAAEVECMPDGLRGRITEADDPSPDPKPSSEPVRRYVGIRERDNTAWLHLEMEDGKSGWARANDLTWAN